MKQTGAAGSAFEHAIPERLFADPSKPLNDPSQPQGVSAVKAIAIAASQGQKIYTLTAHNAAFHANILASLDTNENTKTEIRNALSAGMEVTVHQADITTNSWTGSGYIILDPETGAGAYKISGGMNGGALDFGCGVASGALSYFFGIAYGVQHLLELSGNDSQKAKIAEIVLGAAVNLFGNSAEFRADVMNILWDDLDFYLGKLIMGLLIGVLLTRAVGFIAVPPSAALQVFSTLGYLLGIIEGKPQSQACGSA